jgi:trk system potassium uptake protein TrkA
MKIVIMGCGRVGAQLAILLHQEGHNVNIVDINPTALERLPEDLLDMAIVDDGTDEEALKRAGIEGSDAFVVVTDNDNRNIMAAQIAKHRFNIPRVICRIYDPQRSELYKSLGLEALSPTTIFIQLLKKEIVQS